MFPVEEKIAIVIDFKISLFLISNFSINFLSIWYKVSFCLEFNLYKGPTFLLLYFVFKFPYKRQKYFSQLALQIEDRASTYTTRS